VVRLVLVPAVMELPGAANWWLPRWLDRMLPQRLEAGAGTRGSYGEVPESVGAA
jgi:RND superfamily putative drug exporter